MIDIIKNTKKLINLFFLFFSMVFLCCCNNVTLQNDIKIEKSEKGNYNLISLESIEKIKMVTEYPKDTTIDKMDSIVFGSYPKNNKIEWIVLDRDVKNRKAFLLSKYILDCKKFQIGEESLWSGCSLRKWLNNNFFRKAFSSEEKKRILITDVINNDNKLFNRDGGDNTKDRVFCISVDEVYKYFNQDNMYDENYRLATKGTEYIKKKSQLYVSDSNTWFKGNSFFWLRSVGEREENIIFVYSNGAIDVYGQNKDEKGYGVRPAMWVSY